MARSEQDPTRRFVFTNNVGCGWGGEDRVLADDELGDAVGCCDAEDDLYGWDGEVAAVAADDECSAFCACWDRIEDGLHKVFGVVLLFKDFDAIVRRGREQGEGGVRDFSSLVFKEIWM